MTVGELQRAAGIGKSAASKYRKLLMAEAVHVSQVSEVAQWAK
jgi:hypothetical protein